jgi:hypothetical protein
VPCVRLAREVEGSAIVCVLHCVAMSTGGVRVLLAVEPAAQSFNMSILIRDSSIVNNAVEGMVLDVEAPWSLGMGGGESELCEVARHVGRVALHPWLRRWRGSLH